MSYDTDILSRMLDGDIPERNAAWAYDPALCIDSQTTAPEMTSTCPARNKRKAEEAQCDVVPRRVKASRYEHEEDPGISFSVSREFDYTNDKSDYP
jgi:hypothetical protein